MAWLVRQFIRNALSTTVLSALLVAGAGLLSTARDYRRFLQMMLDGGVLGDTRLPSPTTVDLSRRTSSPW